MATPRKAELWVSVPALHCTGPRLSAASLSLSLSLSSLPHYIFLSSYPPSLSTLLSHSLPPFLPAPPWLPHLPSPCDRGTVTHTHISIYGAGSILSTPESTCTVTAFLSRRRHTCALSGCASSQYICLFLPAPSPP